MEISALHLKIIVLFSFLIMTFLFGMIPVIFIRYIKKVSNQTSHGHGSQSHHVDNDDEQHRNKLSHYKRAISFLSCFAAGVFLATCFLELLPTVQRNLLKILLDNAHAYSGFPAAEFVMVLGLFIILVIEQIVLTVQERSSTSSSEYSEISTEDQPILNHVSRQSSRPAHEDEEHVTESYQRQHPEHSLGGICDEPHIATNSAHYNDEGNEGNTLSTKIPPQGIRPDLLQRQVSRYSLENSTDSHAPRHDHHQPHSPADHSIQTHSVLRAMLLLFALSLHSVFEGITVGLQTDKEKILNIFAALALHKSILSFSLGMNLVQSKISVFSAVKSIVGFSVASPIGVVIGIAITDLWTSTNSGIVHGLLQGIASGTFLYIIFFEILPKEFNCEVDRILKVLFLIVGYATVTAILFLGDDLKEPLCKVANDAD